MLPARGLRISARASNSARKSGNLLRLAQRPTSYSTQTQKEKPYWKKRPAHVSPKDWRKQLRARAVESALRPKHDTPETSAARAALWKAITSTSADLVAIQYTTDRYNDVTRAETKLSQNLVRQILAWICRTRLALFLQLRREPKLDQNPTYVEKKAAMDSLLTDFVAQYKHIRFDPDSEIPVAILHHYNVVHEEEEATKLWNWLQSMRQVGHMSYKTYAARISIEGRKEDSYDVCQGLYEEALNKYGSSLVRYHLSPNAILSDSTQAVSPEIQEAIPLLRAMFPVKIKHGDWKGAYHDLDTILRLDPQRLWRLAKKEVLDGGRSHWEAFLIEPMEIYAGVKIDPTTPIVQTWLTDLAHHFQQKSPDLDALNGIYRVACTLLTTIRANNVTTVTMRKEKGKSPKSLGYDHLGLLWNCCRALNNARGGTAGMMDVAGMAQFILDQLDLQEYTHKANLQESIARYLARVVTSSDVEEKIKNRCDELMEDLLARCRQIVESPVDSFDDRIPGWSSSFTMVEMRSLYQELCQNVDESQTGNTGATEVVSEDIMAQQESQDAHSEFTADVTQREEDDIRRIENVDSQETADSIQAAQATLDSTAVQQEDGPLSTKSPQDGNMSVEENDVQQIQETTSHETADVIQTDNVGTAEEPLENAVVQQDDQSYLNESSLYSTQPIQEHDVQSIEEHGTRKVEEYSTQPVEKTSNYKIPELTHRTQTGFSFAEARFRNWVAMNELFLAATEMDKVHHSYSEQLAKLRPYRRSHIEVKALNKLGGLGLTAEEMQSHQQQLLVRLREFRMHRGENTVI